MPGVAITTMGPGLSVYERSNGCRTMNNRDISISATGLVVKQLRRLMYDQDAVGSIRSRVAIKRLLPGWVTVRGQVNPGFPLK